MEVGPDGLLEAFRQYVSFVFNITVMEQLRENVNNEGNMPITSPQTIELEIPLPCSQSLAFSPYHESNEFSLHTCEILSFFPV
jgi:hypothetical protein